MIIITHRPNSISNHHHPILSVGAHVRACTHARTHSPPPHAGIQHNSVAAYRTASRTGWQTRRKETRPCHAFTLLLLTVHAKFTDGPQSGYSFSARSVHRSPIPSFPLHPSGRTSPPPPLFVPQTLSSLPFIHPSFIFVFLFGCCPPLSAASSLLFFPFFIPLPLAFPSPLPLLPVLHPSPLNNSLEDSSPPSGNKQVGE